MTDTVVETFSTSTLVEVIDATAITISNVIGSATLVETPATVAVEVVDGTPTTTVLEIPAQVALELDIVEGTTIEVETTTGPTGHAPVLFNGTAPPNPATGTVGDLYLVDSGPTIGDLYQKDGSGWGTPKGNLRGGIASVNGISGTNIIIGANNITTGVLPIAQVPTGTSGTTVAFGNHLHTGVYEPVIASGLTTQYWRGDKTWVVIDQASLGLSNVVNVDTSNASNISSGTLAIARIPTGTTGVTVALGNHNHDTAYVALTGTQNVAGAKTFTNILTVDAGAGGLALKPSSGDQTYMALFARTATPTVRSGYFGYASAGATTLDINNELTAGGIGINANTGTITLTAVNVAVGTKISTPALRLGTTTTAGYVLTADASGNATWQQTANIITPGTTAQYYRGDLTWQTLNATAVGLGSVTNDAQVTVSTTQTISGAKTFSSTITGPTSGNVLKVGDDAFIADVNIGGMIGVVGTLDSTVGAIGFGTSAGVRFSGNNTGVANLIAAGGLTISDAVTIGGTITGNGSGLTALPATSLTGTIDINRLPTGTTGITIALGNHVHTGVYEPVLAAGTTAQYYRGDKSWQTLTPAAVGLGNVVNVVQVDLTSGQTITGAKVMNNASNVFTGNGTALTALNATQLTTGTVPSARTTPNTQRFIFTTGAEARPTNTTYVEWVGPVQPANATTDDTWTDTSTAVIEDPVVGMPIGTIQMYAASSAPTNWFVANGQAISRTTYSILFTLIGTTYGVGDGTTTFNLPNMQGRVPTGYMPGNAKFDTMGETGGTETETLTTSQIPAHAHDIPGGYVSPSAQTGFTSAGTAAGASYGFTYSTTQDTATDGGTGGSHNNLAPYIAINFIIKVL